jgi:hypothetical protein
MVNMRWRPVVDDVRGGWWMRPYGDAPMGKALLLLMSMLDDTQRETYKRVKYFECVGSLGTRYRIHRGTCYNVSWLDASGEPAGELCAAPNRFVDATSRELPQEDVILGQLLTLVADERVFLRAANLGEGRWPPCIRHRWIWAVRKFFHEARDALFGQY